MSQLGLTGRWYLATPFIEIGTLSSQSLFPPVPCRIFSFSILFPVLQFVLLWMNVLLDGVPRILFRHFLILSGFNGRLTSLIPQDLDLPNGCFEQVLRRGGDTDLLLQFGL